jgi:hypothetical protein
MEPGSCFSSPCRASTRSLRNKPLGPERRQSARSLWPKNNEAMHGSAKKASRKFKGQHPVGVNRSSHPRRGGTAAARPATVALIVSVGWKAVASSTGARRWWRCATKRDPLRFLPGQRAGLSLFSGWCSEPSPNAPINESKCPDFNGHGRRGGRAEALAVVLK